MMQVLCKPSKDAVDVECPVCGQGFLLFWERSSVSQQESTRPEIEQALCDHHAEGRAGAHPEVPFNIPSWPGLPQFSAAALLGGAIL
jgi:hypothetical protein